MTLHIEKAIECYGRINTLADSTQISVVLDALTALCDSTSLSAACKQWCLLSFSPLISSALETIERHPDWTASVRCLLVCSLLAFPDKIDQAMEYFTPCVEEHMSGASPIPYDWLHKLQSALAQLCSDYYSEENFSFCAVVRERRGSSP